MSPVSCYQPNPMAPASKVALIVTAGVAAAAGAYMLGRWRANQRWRFAFDVGAYAGPPPIHPSKIYLARPAINGTKAEWVLVGEMTPKPGETEEQLRNRAWMWVDSIPDVLL